MLACDDAHVAHNVCLFEHALASPSRKVRCGRPGCGQESEAAAAKTYFDGYTRHDDWFHPSVWTPEQCTPLTLEQLPPMRRPHA